MKIYSNKNGFTIIEIVAVLLVIGIISAIVISRTASSTNYSLDAEAQIIKSHLRYAQVRALSDDTTWGIAFNGNSYTLQRSGINTTIHLPNNNSPIRNLPSGISISPAGTITYNHLGSPGSASITLTLSANGQSQNIIITKNTGFIP